MNLVDRVRYEMMRQRARRVPIDDKVCAAITERARAQAGKLADQAVLPPDAELSAFSRLAAEITAAPTGFVTVLTADRQTIKAGHGLGGGIRVGQPVPLAFSVCAFVVADDRPLAVSDVKREPALSRCLVLGGLRAYNGVPIHLNGQPVGALAVADGKPRRWTEASGQALADIATLVSRRFDELHRHT